MIRSVTLSFTPDQYLALPALEGSPCGEKNILKPALRKARCAVSPSLRCTIEKKSIDARKKNDIRIIIKALITDEPATSAIAAPAVISGRPPLRPPVVIGFGPAGMFAALHLARAGFTPTVIERGRPVAQRISDVNTFFSGGPLLPHSNIQFGEGGAGTFSDGKLYSGISDDRRAFVLETLAQAGAPREITCLAHPHVGTDRLRDCVRTIREEILSLGGTVLFERTVDIFTIEDDTIRGISHCSSVTGEDRRDIETDAVILAIGHSSRDTFANLHAAKITLVPKPFSVGVRIEHPQHVINRSQYGPFHRHPALSPAEYKLVARTSTGRSLYTFCMCPGGYVVAGASAPGQVVTNGMSNYRRDADNANSALLVGVDGSDFGEGDVLAGIRFQEALEHAAFTAGGGNFHAPCQSVGDFIRSRPSSSCGVVRPSYRPGVTFTDLRTILPPFVAATLQEGIVLMNNKIHGFSHPDALLTGIETRSSSPVRILRSDNLCSPDAVGLYPCGEGAGYAGGIMSSAIDGLRCAQAVTQRAGIAATDSSRQ